MALTLRDGTRILRLIFQGISLVECYHQEGEAEEACEVLRLGVESLVDAAGRLGLRERATAVVVLGSVEDELYLMYDDETADRLVHALRQCLPKSRLGGSD